MSTAPHQSCSTALITITTIVNNKILKKKDIVYRGHPITTQLVQDACASVSVVVLDKPQC